MEKIVSFDKQGRIYIPEDLRRQLKSETFVITSVDNSLCLRPIESNPLVELEKLGKDKLKGKSIKKLKEQARMELFKNATKGIC